MIYFSEILNKKVYTDENVYLGKLSDLVFLAQEKPSVTKFVIRGKQQLILPISTIKIINGSITIASKFKEESLGENELFIQKNILDKQIIDIQGNKVVRVNDVIIQNIKQQWTISGVDTSMRSILRWFYLEKILIQMFNIFSLHYSADVLSWSEIQPLELAQGKLQLKFEYEKLKKVRPEDLADYLEKTTVENAREILINMDEEYAADVINSLNSSYQTELIKNFTPENAARMISLIDPDEAVDILLSLPFQDQAAIIQLLNNEKKKEIQHLLDHSRTPIGELMTTEYLTVQSSDTVKEVLKKINQNTADFEQLNYIYVINAEQQLVGVCNLHELLLQKINTPIYKFIVPNVISVHLHTPEEIAITKMLKYKLNALPVLNESKQLLGILTIDDIAEFIMQRIS